MKRKPRRESTQDDGAAPKAAPRPLWFVGRFLAGLVVGQVLVAWFPRLESWAIASTLDSLRFVVRWFGLPGGVDGTLFHLGPSQVEIVGECTPLMPVLVLVAAIAAYPASWRLQLLGVAAGAALLWLFNLFRIGSLMAILAWHPKSFDFVHMYLWQTVTLFVVLLIFLYWTRFQRPYEAVAA